MIHGIILGPTYPATSNLWRPENEMKAGLGTLVSAFVAFAFTGIYGAFVNPKSLSAGLKYGMLYGLAAGASMGFGSYCYMPIPVGLTLTWFVGTLVKMILAGALVGAFIKSTPTPT